MSPTGAADDPAVLHGALTAEEVAGALPLVCARTGARPAELTPVWLARSRGWAWVPLAALGTAAAVTRSWAPRATWWAAGAMLLPLLASSGTTARVPVSVARRRRLANLRRRRLGTMLLALLLTWAAVGLWLVGSRAAGLMVMTVVVVLYVAVVGMFVLTRLLGVGGWPDDDGGVTLTRVHPDFADAVALHRTGHRP